MQTMAGGPTRFAPAPSLLIPILVVGLVPIAGCVELDSSPGEAAPDEFDPSVQAAASVVEEEEDWIEITLGEGSSAPYAREAIHAELTDPEGRSIHKLCATPEFGEYGCASDFDGEWREGTSVWVPCLGEGLHHLEIHVLGVQALSEGLSCDGQAMPDSGSGDQDGEVNGPEQASATASGVDLDDDGDIEWVKVTLTSGENAPYPADEVTKRIEAPNGAAPLGFLCETAADPDCQGSSEEFREADGDEWDVGENLWVPCQQAGEHNVSVSIRGTTIVDATIRCDEGG